MLGFHFRLHFSFTSVYFGRIVFFFGHAGIWSNPSGCTVSRYTTSAYLEADHYGIFGPCTAVYLGRWAVKFRRMPSFFQRTSIPFVVNVFKLRRALPGSLPDPALRRRRYLPPASRWVQQSGNFVDCNGHGPAASTRRQTMAPRSLVVLS